MIEKAKAWVSLGSLFFGLTLKDHRPIRRDFLWGFFRDPSLNKALKIELDPTFIRIVYPTMEHRFTFTHEPLSMNELNALEAILILKLPGSMRPVKLYEAQVLKSIVYTKSEV